MNTNIKQNTFVQLVSVSRVQDWWYLLGITLLAYLHLYKSELASNVVVFPALVFSALYLSWGYMFNNLFDRNEDNSAKNAFAGMKFQMAFRITVLFMLGMVFIASVTALYWETLLVILINVIYSVPPMRFKRYLAFALFANGIFFSFVYYASVKVLIGEVPPSELAMTGFVFLLFLPLQYVHFLEHREQEAKPNSIGLRAWSVIPLLALSFYSFWMIKSLYFPLYGISWVVTVIYSVICLGIVLFISSAKRTRVFLRVLSMIFGIVLLYGVTRN